MSHSIAVVGTGYVGLTTGACLSSIGHRVTCVDIDVTKVSSLLKGQIPIYEDGLADLVADGLACGQLDFTTDLVAACESAEFVFLCLPTPAGADGMADLSAIHEVVLQLRGHLRAGSVIVNKSTVPVNSARMVAELVNDPAVSVVSNPEFLREGSAVRDFLNPDRIVVGSDDPVAGERVASLYLGIRCPIVVTDPVSAESIKYFANAFLATKISFVNEAARFCDAAGANVLEVMRGLSFDPRIGGSFLNPGPGWGGSCFPKDTQALLTLAGRIESPLPIVEQAVSSNRQHIDQVVRLITDTTREVGAQKLCILGLTFKAGTDDVRDSPAMQIIEQLEGITPELTCYDPLARTSIPTFATRVGNLNEALDAADVVAILTEWSEFSAIQPDLLLDRMRGRVVIDGRYLLDPTRFIPYGIEIRSIGRQVPK